MVSGGFHSFANNGRVHQHFGAEVLWQDMLNFADLFKGARALKYDGTGPSYFGPSEYVIGANECAVITHAATGVTLRAERTHHTAGGRTYLGFNAIRVGHLTSSRVVA